MTLSSGGSSPLLSPLNGRSSRSGGKAGIPCMVAKCMWGSCCTGATDVPHCLQKCHPVRIPAPHELHRSVGRSVAICSPHCRQNIHPLRTTALHAGHGTSRGCAPRVARSTPHSLQKSHSRSIDAPHPGQCCGPMLSRSTRPPPHHLQNLSDFGYSMSQSRQYIYISRSTMKFGIDTRACLNSVSGNPASESTAIAA